MKDGATIALSLALAFGAFACPHSAQAANSDQGMRANSSASSMQARQEATQMVPATVHLKKSLDARKVHPGQQFQTVLQRDVQLKNGPKLDSGTILLGRITSDQTHAGQVRLAIRFTQARMKNGQTVPIKATVIQIAQPEGMVGTGTNIADQSGLWTPQTLRVDQIGAISGADLHSAIASRNSGVLVSKKNDIRLNAGSQLELVIAPRHRQSNMNSGV